MAYRDAIGDVWAVKLMRGDCMVAEEQVSAEKGTHENAIIDDAFDQGRWSSEAVYNNCDVVVDVHEPDVMLSVEVD